MSILGVGVDLVNLPRVKRLIARDEDIFRQRILGAVERREISLASDKHFRVLAYACSIAAKEAMLKALGTGLTGGMRWSDVEVVERSAPKPRLAISGETGRILAGFGGGDLQLSLGSVRSHAMALVVVSRQQAKEDSL